MTKLLTVFFVNACKYGEFFVYLQKFLVIIVQPTAF